MKLGRGRQVFLEELDRYLSAVLRHSVFVTKWTSREISLATSTTSAVVASHHCSDIIFEIRSVASCVYHNSDLRGGGAPMSRALIPLGLHLK